VPSLLLNELQKEHRLNQEHVEQLALHQKQITAQASQLSELKQQFAQLQEVNRTMQVALMKLQSKDELVAQR
jgi:hypothetical protein